MRLTRIMTKPLRGPQEHGVTLFAAIAAGALLLAGCGTGGRRGAPQPPGAPATNNVAVLVPLSGEDGVVGQSIADAARLALYDSGNQAIRLTVYNTEEGGAGAAADRAIDAGNRLILGPLLADQVREVAPLARRARVPVISFSNDISAAGNGVYVMGFAPGQAIERVVRHARQNGVGRFAGLVPNTLYGQRAAQGLFSATARTAGQLTSVETYDRTEGARAAARRLSAKGGFDALLIGDTAKAAASFAPQIKSGSRLLGTELWAAERNIGKTPRLRGAWFAAPPDNRFEQFVTRYQARYGSTPMRMASLGYDAVLLTVRAARGWPVGRRFPERALVAEDGFAGVDGIFRFGEDGVAQRAFEVRQVTPAGTRIVSPAPTTF